MNVLLFGATGMVGQGALLECLKSPEVEHMVAVGRTSTGLQHAKLREVLVPDLFDLPSYQDALAGFDACFFCLGVSSVGMTEADYRHITYDLTVGIGRELTARNPGLCFIYVSGAGTDSTEKGRSMWARVKGATENALLAMPFRAAYMMRPGAVVPMDGVRSKTRMYRVAYAVTGPLLPLLRRAFPSAVSTTQEIGRAMISVAARGWPRPVLEPRDIRAAANRGV